MVCAGNFHGEYPAKALDYLAIAIHEIGSMSERRIERLVNPGTLRYVMTVPYFIHVSNYKAFPFGAFCLLTLQHMIELLYA